MLIDLVGWLSNGNSVDFSFKIGTANKTPKEIFRLINNLVLQEVYINGNTPHPGMKIFRQFLISVNSFEGNGNGYSNLPADEKALMRSILFGREINPLDLSKEEINLPLTKTMLSSSGINFCLSNFEHGTFIFLQKEANNLNPINYEYKRKVACFANNCKYCLMLSYLMWQFYSQSGNPDTATDLSKLKSKIPATLKSIPQNYGNLFCKNLFLMHKGLAGLLTK